MSEYISTKILEKLPRIPLEGHIDLTYRCNNNCLHCWLWRPANAPEQKDELTFDEIKNIVYQARAMGTQKWSISGGEPMLRPDFTEIFDYITCKAVSYSINTNGTLITPAIARKLKLKGTKMIALYGATAETYDKVTRHPGGFEMAMQGLRYMQEVGAGFIVQLIPMKANWHEWEQMKHLAESFSNTWRVGATWLYLSEDGNQLRNTEIINQRLAPFIINEIEKPHMGGLFESQQDYLINSCEDSVLASCIGSRCKFNIDPYGGMTFCPFVKDPSLISNLRNNKFQQIWDEFIPSLSDIVHGGKEWKCTNCDNKSNCSWCSVFSYLEHRDYSKPIEYLCQVSDAVKKYKENWVINNRKFFQIADITIQVESDLPINDSTFAEQLNLFQVASPNNDLVKLFHHFELPPINMINFGKQVYNKTPWKIYKNSEVWIYAGVSENNQNDSPYHSISLINHDYTNAQIYNRQNSNYLIGELHSLTLFPSDQILISQLLADRNGCYLHSAGAIINGSGVLFVGHSEAGKSTTLKLLTDPGKNKHAENVTILCDDRNIVRKLADGFHVYGTWSHGEISIVSPASTKLTAICFIEKDKENSIIPFYNKTEIRRRLLACIIRPFVTADWWGKSLNIIESLTNEVPFYFMHFDKSGSIIPEIYSILK